MLSAGCAIGIGNVWRFPYMVGQNGGGLFVLIYLVFLVILGVLVMTMEYAMGRATRKSILPAYPPTTSCRRHCFTASTRTPCGCRNCGTLRTRTCGMNWTRTTAA